MVCYICSNKANYFCNNHCYNYFCDLCKEKLNRDICSHNFKKINEVKQREKSEFVNSILFLIKNYIEFADTIIKSNDEDIIYPILKNSEKIDSIKEFLSDINNLKNIFNNKSKKGICQPIKNFLVKIFELNKSPICKIEDSFSSSYLLSSFSFSVNKIQDNKLNLCKETLQDNKINNCKEIPQDNKSNSHKKNPKNIYSVNDKVRTTKLIMQINKKIKLLLGIISRLVNRLSDKPHQKDEIFGENDERNQLNFVINNMLPNLIRNRLGNYRLFNKLNGNKQKYLYKHNKKDIAKNKIQFYYNRFKYETSKKVKKYKL